MSPAILTSSSRVFPTEPSSARTTALSILDASVGNFSATAAAWVYDAPIGQGETAMTPANLKLSLATTLNAYPQWAGQLQYTTYLHDGNHTSRSRRLEVTYGAHADPGVEYVVASSSTDVAEFFPSLEERTSGRGAFDASSLGALNFLPNSPALASQSSGDMDFTGLPCLIVQVTSFKCGGVVIALKASHPMADAQTLATFMNDWAAVNRALVQNLPPPVLSPIFSPADLDQAALGNIDAPLLDPEIVKVAHELPIYRYDWWASADGCPAGAFDATTIPSHLASLTDLDLGPPMPWQDWDLQAPVSNFLLYFSADELARIWAAAASPGPSISRFDALQAHLWSVLIRARAPQSAEYFHLNLSLGMRERVASPLGAHALGSPLVLARASGMSSMSLAQLAREIRDTVTQFTPPRVGALLHEMAFDVDARRMWGGFIGRRNTIVTSWMRLGVYEVDFGGGARPRFVHGVMPAMDGIVQIMEAGPRSSAGGPWYQDGANVSLMLTTEVIQRMLEDPLLRKYHE